ncbi:presenilin family intramembrane aspartyl protease [Chloroflexota bacterium]
MKSKLSLFLWGGLVMVLALTLALYEATREKLFFEANQIVSPDISLGPIVAYFFSVVGILTLVLFITPLSKLRLVFRILFALMFAWGVFVITALTLPTAGAYPVAIIAGISWLFWPRVWLHNLLFLIALAGAGSVFGFLFSPWTFMIFMLIIAVYDILAVHFGFMVWMVDKLSESTTLPAFIFPKQIRDWKLSLQNVRLDEIKKNESAEREYTVLGGGDVGFPLMLAVSIYFTTNLASAIFVGVFALVGLMSALLIQLLWLKGKPIPALPPIAGLSLIGFIIASSFLS